MGTHHGGDGGEPPPEGDRSPDPELPDLPPEWRGLSIPDDPADLAEEAEQVRYELARERAGHGSSRVADRSTEPTLGTPLLIMAVAVAVTLLGFLVMARSGTTTTPGGAESPPPEQADHLPSITLPDAAGRPVTLTAHAPLVLLLVEECDCHQLIRSTYAAAPTGVRVAVVARAAPDAPPGLDARDEPLLRLADLPGRVRSRLGLGGPTDDAATVLLVDRDDRIRDVVPAATSTAQFQNQLTGLAG